MIVVSGLAGVDGGVWLHPLVGVDGGVGPSSASIIKTNNYIFVYLYFNLYFLQIFILFTYIMYHTLNFFVLSFLKIPNCSNILG